MSARDVHAGLIARLSPRRLTRGFAGSVSGVFLLQIISTGLSVITGVLLGRFLGPRGYGAYVFGLGWVAVLGVPAVLGLDKVLVRLVPAYDVQGESSMLHGLFRRTDQAVFLIALVVGGIATAIGAVVLSSPFRTPFLIAMLLLPITAMTIVRTGAMTALGRVAVGQLPEFVIQPAAAITALVVVHLAIGHSLNAPVATAITVGSGTLAFAVGRRLLRRSIPRGVRRSEPRYATREWMRTGLPMMLVAGMFILDSYAATLVAGSVGGARVVGVLAVVARIAATVALLLTALTTVLAPRIARLYVLGDQDEAQRLVDRTARVAFAGAVPVALGLIVFRHQCLALFGNGFGSGGLALIIVALGQLVNAATGPANVVLSMTGNQKSAGLGIGIGLIFTVGLTIALVPGMGVVGAAIATAAAMTVRNLALVFLARRKVGLDTSLVRISRSRHPATIWTPARPAPTPPAPAPAGPSGPRPGRPPPDILSLRAVPRVRGRR